MKGPQPMAIKKGRKPLKSKPVPNMSFDDLFGNPLSIPEDLQKELDRKQLVGHWISWKQLVDGAGYHKRGWIPYRREKSDKLSNEEFAVGSDPDGFFRKGSLVLGVKKRADWQKHKAFLRHRAIRYRDSFQKKQAEELRRMGKEIDPSFRVHEGYEDSKQALLGDADDD